MDKKTIFTSLLSGLLLGMLLVVYTNYVALSVVTEFALLFQVAVVIALGFITGWILKDKLTDSYLISIFALLFTYGVSNLVVATRGVHYFIYVLLVALIAVIMFSICKKFFEIPTLSRPRKTIIATGIFIVVTVLCAALGLYISRLVSN